MHHMRGRKATPNFTFGSRANRDRLTVLPFNTVTVPSREQTVTVSPLSHPTVC